MLARSHLPLAPLPLAQYPLFHTRDVDEARESVARIFCPHGLSTPKPNRTLDARFHSVQLHEHVRLNYVQYGPCVDIDPGYLGEFYLLQIPLRGSALVTCGTQQITAEKNMASMPSPTERLHMRWADNSPHLIVRFAKTAVHRQLEQLTQNNLRHPLVFDLGVNMASPRVAPMINFIKYLCATVDSNPAFAQTALASQAESYLIATLLTSLDHNHSAAFETTKRVDVLPRSVKRAQELMQSQAKHPLSLADLCQQLGVSARALQVAFQTHMGQSPMQYWRDLRLDHVRSALLTKPQVTTQKVPEIAADFGFAHLGHFSEQYQKRFGQTPRQTLMAGAS